MKFKLLVISFFLCSTLFANPFSAFAESAIHDPVKIPSFRIRNLTGKQFDSRKNQGSPLVLSFFFTRCPPCIKEMPELYQFMRQEGRLKQLLFVDSYVKALKVTDAPDTKRQINKFIQKLKIPAENTYFDKIGSLLKKIRKHHSLKQANKMGTLMIYPTILVIDGKGRIVLTMEGSRLNFIEKIKEVL